MPTVPRASELARLGRGLRDPIVSPEATASLRETESVSFADLVRMAAEGIADAQAGLDRSSADMLQELAKAEVTLPGEIREVIAADGSVSFEQGEERKASLLELGVLPTFYQFSETKVEVAMDIKVLQEEKVNEEGKRRIGLFAGTMDLRVERKLNRDVSTHSKVTTTLVPVPAPVRLAPLRATVTPEA